MNIFFFFHRFIDSLLFALTFFCWKHRYGQTGSGKTWTCFGPSPNEASYQPNNRGLVQRACEEIFQASEERQKLGIESKLSVSYVEVYGNEVTDLLKNGERVGHNKVSSQRYVCDIELLLDCTIKYIFIYTCQSYIHSSLCAWHSLFFFFLHFSRHF